MPTAAEELINVGGGSPASLGASFVMLTSLAQGAVLIGLYCFAQPTSLFFKEAAQNVQLYNYYVNVALMMFVGFGYLMTFLRWYGLGAVGFTMLVTCLGVQVSALVEPIMVNGFTYFNVDLMCLLNANFAVAAFLISFGGIIGKANPSQLVVLTCLEAVFYCANKVFFLTNKLGIMDCGGTIIIHMFGAYFGLAVSFVLGKPQNTDKETNSTVSDIFSLVGTVFLWLYWPSFVGGAIPAGTVEAETALTNTVLALLGSTVTTFFVSPMLSGKMIRPVDIQNATLAGGVSIGAVANLNLGPFGAGFIGSLAGLLSTYGFCRVQDFVHDKVGLHDSCGIHNLHGMPSVLGGLCSVFVPLIIDQGEAGKVGRPMDQLIGVIGTIIFAVGTGVFTGGVMNHYKGVGHGGEGFNDQMYWEVAPDFGKGA